MLVVANVGKKKKRTGRRKKNVLLEDADIMLRNIQQMLKKIEEKDESGFWIKALETLVNETEVVKEHCRLHGGITTRRMKTIKYFEKLLSDLLKYLECKNEENKKILLGYPEINKVIRSIEVLQKAKVIKDHLKTLINEIEEQLKTENEYYALKNLHNPFEIKWVSILEELKLELIRVTELIETGMEYLSLIESEELEHIERYIKRIGCRIEEVRCFYEEHNKRTENILEKYEYKKEEKLAEIERLENERQKIISLMRNIRERIRVLDERLNNEYKTKKVNNILKLEEEIENKIAELKGLQKLQEKLHKQIEKVKNEIRNGILGRMLKIIEEYKNKIKNIEEFEQEPSREKILQVIKDIPILSKIIDTNQFLPEKINDLYGFMRHYIKMLVKNMAEDIKITIIRIAILLAKIFHVREDLDKIAIRQYRIEPREPIEIVKLAKKTLDLETQLEIRQIELEIENNRS